MKTDSYVKCGIVQTNTGLAQVEPAVVICHKTYSQDKCFDSTAIVNFEYCKLCLCVWRNQLTDQA